MSNIIGFYGGGNMGVAIMKGMLQANIVKPNDILVFDTDESVLNVLNNELGVRVTKDQYEVAKLANTIILAVKPNIVNHVLDLIKEYISAHTIVISIAAGIAMRELEKKLPPKTKVARVMPNTPVFVGEGMSAITLNEYFTAEEKEEILALFTCFGKAEFIAENLMDAVVGVSGSAPAYVYMFIEALADGAVLCGMPRKQAYQFAAQTVLGSAKMVLETGNHPGVLKDAVCSPGGTTIEAVKMLEKKGLRSTVIDAVCAAADRNANMK